MAKVDKRSSWFGSSTKPPKSKNKKGASKKQKDFVPDPELNEELMKVDRMSDAQLNSELETMLDDMNVTNAAARNDILSRPLNEKRQLLRSFHLKDQQAKKIEGPNSPHEFLTELKNDLTREQLFNLVDRLRISLSTNGLSWVKEFGELKGLNLLLNILESSVASTLPMMKKIQYSSVRCLKAFMNNKYGLRDMLQSEKGLIIFVSAMDPSNENMMADVLRVSAAVCLVADGHDRILEALTVNGEISGMQRFEVIVMALKNTDNPALQDACMQFINAVVSTPADDVDFKMHLRNEFMRCGLGVVLPNLYEIQHRDLLTHLEIFESEREVDYEELVQRLNGIQLELDDTVEVFRVLNNSTYDSKAGYFFLSILQHLLLIRDDYYAKPEYYRLIEECVSQIVLHNRGVDPDFHYTKRFSVNVDTLIEGMVDKARVEEAERKSLELETLLHQQQTHCYEMEQKLTQANEQYLAAQEKYDAKIRKLEDEKRRLNEELVNRPAGGGGGGGSGSAPAGAGAPPPPPPPPAMGGGPPPPPPPPPGPGGGPPPPPPPFPGAGPPGAPPPPPFGGGGIMGRPLGLPQKKKYKLDKQIRRVQWNKLKPNQLSENAFWLKINETDFETPDLLNDLEKTFATSKGKGLGEVEKPVFKAKAAKELKILDAKAAQNISICLGTLRMSHHAIKQKVLQCDEELSEQALSQLLKFLPGPEEIVKLQDLRGRYTELHEAEQFGVIMSDIRGLHGRLECQVFAKTFTDELDELLPSISAVTAACREIKGSQKFAKLLQLVLLMGNYMNAGSRNEQTVGFELNFLTKMSSTRSADQKTTLLHFLANTVEQRHPDLLDLASELRNVEPASRASDETITAQIKKMDASFKKIKDQVKRHKPQDADDLFAEKMKDFISKSEDRFRRVVDQQKLMEEKFEEIIKYFCLDKKTTMEEFFGDLSHFLKEFERAHKENMKIKEQLEKERKRKEDSRTLKKPKQTRSRAPVVDITGVEDKEGVLDDLIATLQTGQAFKRPGKKGTKKAPAAPQNSAAAARAIAKTLGNEEQSKYSGAIPIIPSPIPPTPMDTPNSSQKPPVFPQQYNAPTSSYQSKPTSNNTGFIDYSSDTSPYNQRKPNVLPNSNAPSIPNSGGPSLAEEILSSLRTTNTTRNADGLPSTML